MPFEHHACVLLFHLSLRESFVKATMMVSKIRRCTGEAVVGGKAERSHQALVPYLLRALRSGFVATALIYVWFKAAFKKTNHIYFFNFKDSNALI